MDWQGTLFVAGVTIIALFGTIVGLTVAVGVFFHIITGIKLLKQKQVFRRMWNFIKSKIHENK